VAEGQVQATLNLVFLKLEYMFIIDRIFLIKYGITPNNEILYWYLIINKWYTSIPKYYIINS
jgi:hypothetical protein